MTPEEYENVLNRMLEIQQDIQTKLTKIAEKQNEIVEQQKANTKAIALLTENISNSNATAQRYEDRSTRLYHDRHDDFT